MLDSQMYPHLLDLIAENAPYAVLVRLRACSRALRVLADKLLNGPRLILSSSMSCKSVVSCPGGKVPAFSLGLSSASSPDVDLSLLRVVDIVGPAFRHNLGMLSYAQCPNGYTLRFISSTGDCDALAPLPSHSFGIPDHVHTIVCWVSLPSLILHLDEASSIFQHCTPERLVVNVLFNVDDVIEAIYQPYALPSMAAEIVYVFHSSEATNRYEQTNCDYDSEHRPGGFFAPPNSRRDPGKWPSYGLYQLLNELATALMLTLQNGGPVIVVNVEALASPWLEGGGDDNPQSNFYMRCAMAAQDVDVDDTGVVDADAVTDALDAIEFYSLDEYRAEIGPERAAIETTLSGGL
ncbi:hypothetical protein CcaverHIS002_0113310 [Cutaneotrichosporon cavernicola]|uniref:Uncharacterized protein n=1 Tax=Cutaneotrichosporon cavernicola TaxID=279322 RepID=A0AA48I692_9TREE|nr:uncharacterized protein CcaverHIS019_0113180 [Cutaneotrichosporon cavernicola]BEI80802.1 hypothetical protein CcaverHIS002_0113310 [Cutaneotrichosporon cavernicola]BEI88600.1 hypothetical protein CcaverHIS019_0113180 [Cutaneotrichosporon cavernicola]BEI96373.1 hypothetical protein CcaverHIS631_0113220 [Cutaneotrichosporon cavernicola]BEJ04145.1 hypothetical protein CcaverHIS641_0113200 [Cutaneotrichosporon cavernicola]